MASPRRPAEAVLAPGAGPRRGALPALRRLRRLPLPGLRVRAAARGEGAAGARRAHPARRIRRPTGRADRAGRLAVPLPQQARVLLHARPDGPALGFHRAGRWDEVLADRGVPADDRSSATRSATPCRPGRARRSSRPYDQDTQTGYLRHLVVREGRNTGQVLVHARHRPRRAVRRGLPDRDAARFPEVRSIHWAINDTPAEVTNLPTRAALGGGVRSRRRSSGCASACGRTRSCRRTPRWPRRSTRSRARPPG